MDGYHADMQRWRACESRCVHALLVVLVLPVYLVGCASSPMRNPNGGAGATGAAGASGTSGTAGVGGNTNAALYPLPVPPGGGIAQPSGTPGNLTVLNWAGFKAAVSYTFDDTNSSQIQHYPALQALGVRMTFYLITSKTSDLNNPVWVQAMQDGHELANHTRTHAMTGTAEDVDGGDMDLQQKFGITVWTMASPYGNTSYLPLAATRYLINRGVNGGRSPPTTTPIRSTSSLLCPRRRARPRAAFNAEIDAVRTAGRWKTVLVHGFNGGSDGAYCRSRSRSSQPASSTPSRSATSGSTAWSTWAPTGARRSCSRR